MKAIAEYFRDLAADDRYFGAEPPTPDVEMLARIAEREIARRVEARSTGTGVVLRVDRGSAASETAEDPGLAASPAETADRTSAVATTGPADADMPETGAAGPEAAADADSLFPDPGVTESGDPQTDAEPDLGPAPEAATAPPAAAAPAMPPAPRAPVAATATPTTALPAAVALAPADPPAHPDADSVAAKLQRIRAVVGTARDPLISDDETDQATDQATGAQDGADEVPATAATVPNELAADGPAADGAATPAAAEPPIRPRVIKVRRADIATAVSAALVAQRPEPAPQEAASAAAQSETVPSTDAAQARADIPDLAGVDATARTAPDHDLTEASTPTDGSVAEPAIAGPATTDGDMAQSATDETAIERAATAGDGDAEPAFDEDPFDTATFDDLADDDDDDAARIAESDFGPEDGDIDDLAELARLDGSAALDPDAPVTETADDSLPPDAEAELMAELAEVERDLAAAVPTTADPATDAAADQDDDEEALAGQDAADVTEEENWFSGTDEDAADAAPAAAAPLDMAAPATAPTEAPSAASPVTGAPRPRRVVLDAAPEADEQAMSRLISQTNAELDDPQAERRRAAIAQLKAAVVATEAARSLGEVERPAPGEPAENAFREDLSRVVRPTRPAVTGEARSRGERPRPAPLKLVQAQRVDLPQATERPAGPVRPRRVSSEPAPDTRPAAARTDAGQTGSFAEFAQAAGAHSLADLLEAAAAYTAYVEGMEDFSRPQLMNKVREMAPEDFSREDQMRSFGTLLRQGRITKVRNGRFQVSAETRFHPERRAG